MVVGTTQRIDHPAEKQNSSGAHQDVTPAHKEALNALQDYSNLPKPKTDLSAFDQGSPPTFQNAVDTKRQVTAEPAAADTSEPGVIDPGKTIDPSVITPDDYFRRKALREGREMDDQGNLTAEEPLQFFDPAKGETGPDGRVKKVTSEDTNNGTKSTFEIDEQGNVTRTIESNDGTEVVKFGADGRPVSKTFTEKGSTDAVPETPEANDRVTVTKGADGKTTIESTDTAGDTNTKIELDKDGHVTSRSVSDPEGEIVTQFNPDGKSATYTEYDKDHRLQAKTVASEGQRTTEIYDGNGKLDKVEHEDDEYLTVDATLKDGSKMSSVLDKVSGQSKTIINAKDGTRIELDEGPNSSTTRITNPDGSFTETSDNPQEKSYKVQDKDGYWTWYAYEKQSGVASTLQGRGNDVYGPGIESVPI